MESSSRGLGMRIVALLVLAAAAWVLLKVVIGVITTIATIAAVVLALVAIIWAIRVF